MSRRHDRIDIQLGKEDRMVWTDCLGPLGGDLAGKTYLFIFVPDFDGQRQVGSLDPLESGRRDGLIR